MEIQTEAVERFIAIQLKGQDDLSNADKTAVILSRRKRFVFMIGINVLAVLFFTYSINAGISKLPKWILGALFVIFALNIAVIFRQLHWVKKALEFLKEEK